MQDMQAIVNTLYFKMFHCITNRFFIARHAILQISLQALQHIFPQYASAIRYESVS